MDKHFSLYLDLVRFVAALLVVLTHYTQHGLFGPAAKAAGHTLGREAVMVFFILSGFVVARTTIERALSLRQFALARATRIYTVALPVLLAAFGAGLIVMQLPGMQIESGYQLAKPWIYLPLHLLFMGEWWTLAETPPWLVPYWSLSYEVWYYVLFATAFYGRGAWRWLLTGTILLLVGPKLWLLLPVWLSGVWLARQAPLAIGSGVARFGCAATLGALALFKIAGLDIALRAAGIGAWPFPALPISSADRYLADYAVGAIMLLHFACARQARFACLLALAGPIRSLASSTFVLYLVHGLIMGLWDEYHGGPTTGPADLLLLTACIGAATYACSIVTERQRAWLRRRFDARPVLPAAGLA